MWTSNPNFASLLIHSFPIVVKNLAPIDKERGRSIHGCRNDPDGRMQYKVANETRERACVVFSKSVIKRYAGLRQRRRRSEGRVK